MPPASDAFPSCVPVLSDGVVRLRAHHERDVERIVEQSTDARSQRWTSVPRDYTRALAREWIATVEKGWNAGGNADRTWAIEEVADETGAYCGGIDVRPRGGGRAEIGYGLHPDARGKGLMKRALRLVIKHWFDGGGRRVDWYAERGNFASWAAARAAGFGFVADLPEHLPDRDGGLVDAWFASIGRDDDGAPRAPWFHPPILVGDGVRLRPWTEDDGEFIEEPQHAPHHLPDRGVPRPDTFSEWLLRRRENLAFGRAYNWCIADAETDRALGDVCVFGFEVATGGASGEGELGYFLFPSARGRGAATVAARLVTTWALTPVAEAGLGLRRITAVTASDNAASIAVLTALGFTRWGHERAATAPDGSVGPADHWELTPTALANAPVTEAGGDRALSVDFTHKPTLVGELVTLRPVTADDYHALAPAMADPQVTRLTGSRSAVDPDLAREWYRTRKDQADRLDLAVVENSSGAVVGEAVLNDWDSDNRSANFRIFLDREAQGRGLGTEATQLIVGYGFEQVGLHRISLGVYAFNPRARRAYEKAGFVVEGVLRDALLWDGERVDEIVMSILRSDWDR